MCHPFGSGSIVKRSLFANARVVSLRVKLFSKPAPPQSIQNVGTQNAFNDSIKR